MIEQITSYVIIFAIVMVLINILFDVCKNIKQKVLEMSSLIRREIGIIKTTKEKELKEKRKKLKYFMLFEFFLENCEDEESGKIKKEYYSIIQENLREKYEKYGLRSYYMNKLFFECVDFSIIDQLISDLVSMYEHFKNLNEKRAIKTNIKFSIIAESKDFSFKYAQKMLLGINATSSFNLVISNDEFCKQYKKEKLELYDFQPKGLINLIDSDQNIEVYRLVKRAKDSNIT